MGLLSTSGSGGGVDVFFLACEDFRGMFNNSFLAYGFVVVVVFKWKFSSRKRISLFMPESVHMQ